MKKVLVISDGAWELRRWRKRRLGVRWEMALGMMRDPEFPTDPARKTRMVLEFD